MLFDRRIVAAMACAIAPGWAHADYSAAAAYSESTGGVAMVVVSNGAIVYEDYEFPIDKFISWKIYSGTKGLTGVFAAAAVQAGLIGSIDDLVSSYLPEWSADPVKSTVTIRDLLTLTSGINTPPMGEGDTLMFADAVALSLNAAPGDTFVWGAGAYQVFGEILRRQLYDRAYSTTDPMTFFCYSVMKEISAPAPVSIWVKTADQHTNLSTGARIMARSWALLGKLVLDGGVYNGKQLLDPATLQRLAEGTTANPGFGLGWGNTATLPAEQMALGGIYAESQIWLPDPEDLIPDDLIMTAGAGRQRLYVVPSLNLVVVRQTSRSFFTYKNFDDREFWRLLLAPAAPTAP